MTSLPKITVTGKISPELIPDIDVGKLTIGAGTAGELVSASAVGLLERSTHTVTVTPINDAASSGDSLALPTIQTVRNYVNEKVGSAPMGQSLAFHTEQFDYDDTNTFTLQYTPQFVFHVYIVKETMFTLADFTFAGTELSIIGTLEEGDRIQVQYVADEQAVAGPAFLPVRLNPLVIQKQSQLIPVSNGQTVNPDLTTAVQIPISFVNGATSFADVAVQVTGYDANLQFIAQDSAGQWIDISSSAIGGWWGLISFLPAFYGQTDMIYITAKTGAAASYAIGIHLYPVSGALPDYAITGPAIASTQFVINVNE